MIIPDAEIRGSQQYFLEIIMLHSYVPPKCEVSNTSMHELDSKIT